MTLPAKLPREKGEGVLLTAITKPFVVITNAKSTTANWIGPSPLFVRARALRHVLLSVNSIGTKWETIVESCIWVVHDVKMINLYSSAPCVAKITTQTFAPRSRHFASATLIN